MSNQEDTVRKIIAQALGQKEDAHDFERLEAVANSMMRLTFDEERTIALADRISGAMMALLQATTDNDRGGSLILSTVAMFVAKNTERLHIGSLRVPDGEKPETPQNIDSMEDMPEGAVIMSNNEVVLVTMLMSLMFNTIIEEETRTRPDA